MQPGLFFEKDLSLTIENDYGWASNRNKLKILRKLNPMI